MKLTDLHPTIQEALALHEAFRRLKFPADDIFVIVGNAPEGPALFVQARRHGCEFTATAGLYEPPPDFAERWAKVTAAWNGDGKTMTLDHKTIWEGSNVKRRVFDFVMAMYAKGMLPSQSAALAAMN